MPELVEKKVIEMAAQSYSQTYAAGESEQDGSPG